VALLPYTLPDPEKPGVRSAFDCTSCRELRSSSQRAAMHCGWSDIPRASWPAKIQLPPVPGPPEPVGMDICPGWLVRTPGVVEATEAYSAMEAGILDRYDPRGARVVTLAALAAKRAFNVAEAERMKKKNPPASMPRGRAR
jgi:hypothetical protein